MYALKMFGLSLDLFEHHVYGTFGEFGVHMGPFNKFPKFVDLKLKLH